MSLAFSPPILVYLGLLAGVALGVAEVRGSPAAPAPRLTTQETPTTPPRGLAARADVQGFIAHMARQHAFDPQQLTGWFALVELQEDVLARMRRPAEKTKPWHQYRAIFLDEPRIRAGAAFYRQYQAALARAEAQYGVDPWVIVAIIGVETRFGRITGRDGVLSALATLAFGHPPRADFFVSELEHYLLLTREEGIDPLSLRGSYAGAMGIPQFMPSSYRHFAVDFDGDGQRDLWRNPLDAIGSVANYLQAHGWRPGEPVAVPAEAPIPLPANLAAAGLKPRYTLAELAVQGVAPLSPLGLPPSTPATPLVFEGQGGGEPWLGFANFYAITRYNHSPLYALAVHQLSRAVAASSPRERAP